MQIYIKRIGGLSHSLAMFVLQLYVGSWSFDIYPKTQSPQIMWFNIIYVITSVHKPYHACYVNPGPICLWVPLIPNASLYV